MLSQQPNIKKIIYKDKITLGDILDSFINNEIIKKLLEERGDSVHSYAYWRYENPYRSIQDYTSLEKQFKKILTDAFEIVEEYHINLSSVIMKDLGLVKSK